MAARRKAKAVPARRPRRAAGSARPRLRRKKAEPVPVVETVPAIAGEAAVFPEPAGTSRNPSTPWLRLAGFFVFTFLMIAVGGFIVHTTKAATFQPPSQAPPGGNIPVTIWNRVSSGARQANAAIDIDGGGPAPTATGLSVGANTLNLGNAAGGQNIFYGVADYAGMHSADYLLLLQTHASGVFTTRLSVDRNGTVITPSSISASGAVTGSAGMTIGNASLNLGNAAGGQNAAYVVSRYEFMHPTGDYLLKLQTYTASAPAGYTDRFLVNRDGDATSAGCWGRTLVGLTTAAWPGNVGSYYAADNKCATDYPATGTTPAAHVCTVEQILESIACSQPGDPIRSLGGEVSWVNGGPPGFTANARDCQGWQTNVGGAYGRVWIYDNTTGGTGTQTTCNTAGLKFACCR